ncbi:hypothetical protein AAF712_007046 [Marasmius tenuissimus]|uniref:Uncharacterized protein n=1 Tax=Marasmius tenuissimus TaxID=585030 RepID=A0ABR2ZX58_9AGAR
MLHNLNSRARFRRLSTQTVDGFTDLNMMNTGGATRNGATRSGARFPVFRTSVFRIDDLRSSVTPSRVEATVAEPSKSFESSDVQPCPKDKEQEVTGVV